MRIEINVKTEDIITIDCIIGDEAIKVILLVATEGLTASD